MRDQKNAAPPSSPPPQNFTGPADVEDMLRRDGTHEEKIGRLAEARSKIPDALSVEQRDEFKRQISLAMEQLVAARYLLR